MFAEKLQEKGVAPKYSLVGYADADGLKDVNDTFGHDEGDSSALISLRRKYLLVSIMESQTVIEAGQRIVLIHGVHLLKKDTLMLQVYITTDTHIQRIGNGGGTGVVGNGIVLEIIAGKAKGPVQIIKGLSRPDTD